MKKFFFWGLAILVIFLGLFIYWKYFFTYSEGNRAGLLQKFSYRGTLFKTYEGEMVMSSVQSNKEVVLASEKFLFSVENEKIANKLKQLQGYLVVVHYNEKNGKLPWRGESKYIVDSVQIQH